MLDIVFVRLVTLIIFQNVLDSGKRMIGTFEH